MRAIEPRQKFILTGHIFDKKHEPRETPEGQRGMVNKPVMKQ